jgi:hypothetical protein
MWLQSPSSIVCMSHTHYTTALLHPKHLSTRLQYYLFVYEFTICLTETGESKERLGVDLCDLEVISAKILLTTFLSI